MRVGWSREGIQLGDLGIHSFLELSRVAVRSGGPVHSWQVGMGEKVRTMSLLFIQDFFPPLHNKKKGITAPILEMRKWVSRVQ